MVPSAVVVVLHWIRLVVGLPPAIAIASHLVMLLTSDAVTVAATSVSISSTLPGAAAAKASNEMPHSMIFAAAVADGTNCSMVLMAVPVVTMANAAVVCIGPLGMRYAGMSGFSYQYAARRTACDLKIFSATIPPPPPA